MKSNKAEKVKIINKKTLIVALDIGKNVHYGYFRTPKNKDIKPFPIYNTRQSFKRFWGKLCGFREEPESVALKLLSMKNGHKAPLFPKPSQKLHPA